MFVWSDVQHSKERLLSMHIDRLSVDQLFGLCQ